MDLTPLVRQVRAKYGESQQRFANRLGISIRALANYEKDRNPTGKALTRLTEVANQAGLKNEADQFSQALSKEIGADLGTGFFRLDRDEEVLVAAFIEALRNRGLLPEIQKSVNALLKDLETATGHIQKRRNSGTMIFRSHVQTELRDFKSALARLRGEQSK